jgi:putative flippase GtrA
MAPANVSPVFSRQLFQFGLVGVVGFATDAAVFLALTQAVGLAVMPARVAAFVPATVVTWLLNRVLVFRTSGSPRRKRDEYLRHFGIQSIGIAINFAVFYLAVRAGLGRHSAQLLPLALGSLVAMAFNYAGARKFVFLH